MSLRVKVVKVESASEYRDGQQRFLLRIMGNNGDRGMYADFKVTAEEIGHAAKLDDEFRLVLLTDQEVSRDLKTVKSKS